MLGLDLVYKYIILCDFTVGVLTSSRVDQSKT